MTDTMIREYNDYSIVNMINETVDKEAEIRAEVSEEFEHASEIGRSGRQQLEEKIAGHHGAGPELSGGDIDAAWEDADVGEETVGGENPTPDQDIVEKLGEAEGVTYQDNEPLGTERKLEKRDEDRWELNPSSASENK